MLHFWIFYVWQLFTPISIHVGHIQNFHEQLTSTHFVWNYSEWMVWLQNKLITTDSHTQSVSQPSPLHSIASPPSLSTKLTSSPQPWHLQSNCSEKPDAHEMRNVRHARWTDAWTPKQTHTSLLYVHRVSSLRSLGILFNTQMLCLNKSSTEFIEFAKFYFKSCKP